MKKLLTTFLLFVAFLVPSFAQRSVEGDFSVLRDAMRVNFTVDFSQADIMGMNEEEFLEYEPRWASEKPDIVATFPVYANAITNNSPRLGNYRNEAYTLNLVVRAVDTRGGYDCDLFLLHGGRTLASATGFYAVGGIFGSKLNLFKDGSKHTGMAIGFFLRRQLSED